MQHLWARSCARNLCEPQCEGEYVWKDETGWGKRWWWKGLLPDFNGRPATASTAAGLWMFPIYVLYTAPNTRSLWAGPTSARFRG